MPAHAVAPAVADLIPSLVAGVASPRASTRFRSSKALAQMAEDSPQLLYPRFDFFLGQLDNPNSILRWNAMRALAGLAPADRVRAQRDSARPATAAKARAFLTKHGAARSLRRAFGLTPRDRLCVP